MRLCCFLISITLIRKQNFIINAAQTQLNGLTTDEANPIAVDLDRIENVLTCLFTAELLLNMYAHWFRAFFSSSYNLFDLIVISLSLVALGPINLPISVLRVIRAFRVIRIVGRLAALRNIVAALTKSIIPVCNAFIIVLLFISICEKPLRISAALLALLFSYILNFPIMSVRTAQGHFSAKSKLRSCAPAKRTR